jgi:phospholipid/cholesterol/gamma-HCH transport system substrate-binding protein
MDKRKRNLTAIGLLTVVSAIAFVWGTYWMLGTPILRKGMDVTVALQDGGGLKRSDKVQVKGVEVGLVRNVRLAPNSGVIAHLRLNEDIELPADTRAVVTGDVFGAHIVELVPGRSTVKLGERDTIRGGTAPELTQLATNLSSRVESVLISADSLLSPAAVADVHETAAVLPAGAHELRAAFAELRLAAASLRRSSQNLEAAAPGTAVAGAVGEIERTARVLNTAAGRMDQSVTSLASVMNKIDSGHGTLGRLVNDSTMFFELNHTLREVRALATDIRERPSRYITVRIF